MLSAVTREVSPGKASRVIAARREKEGVAIVVVDQIVASFHHRRMNEGGKKERGEGMKQLE